MEVVYQLAISVAFYSVETLYSRDYTVSVETIQCILFDDTKKFTYEMENVLSDVEKQKHTHISLMKKLFSLSSVALIILYHGLMILVTYKKLKIYTMATLKYLVLLLKEIFSMF